MSESTKKQRPKNLNLLTIRLPINALVSIMHRMSGMVLFLMLPLSLCLLSVSLSGEAGYESAKGYLDHWFFNLIQLLFSWAFFHHFYAGIRHLAHDMHWMHGLKQARNSSHILIGLVAMSVISFLYFIWS